MRFNWLHTLSVAFLLCCSVARGEDIDAAIELTLTPRAIESPILKYRLMPTEPQLKDGNAAVVILRMPWDQQPYMQEVYPKIPEYRDIPLDDPRILENGTAHFDGFYQTLRRAAYMRSADWNYPIGEGHDVEISLPDVQGGRQFAGWGLSVWIRYHIAKGDLAQAREGILVGLAVSRHYARTPFLIVHLVSNALNIEMFNRVEELISQPEAPNLYWALSALPSPMLVTRPAFELEDQMLERSQKIIDLDDSQAEFLPEDLRGDELLHLDRKYSAEQWEEIADALIWLLHLYDDAIEKPTLASRNNLIAKFAARGRAAPAEIGGLRETDIAGMTDTEVGVRWYLARHRDYREQFSAYGALPPLEAIPQLRELQENSPKFWEELGLKQVYFFSAPLNQYIMLKSSDQRVALLRTIEALRHYAATHEGRLPATLADITDIPVPFNPLTGEPFDYKRDRDTATLSAEPVAWHDVPNTANPKRPLGAVNYRIRMRAE